MSEATPPPPDEAHEQARERAQMPALFLVANGALNLLVGLVLAGYAVSEAATPAGELHDAWMARLRAAERDGQQLPEPLGAALRKARDEEPGRFKRQRVAADAAAAAFVLLAAALGVAGGARMYRARSYELAVVGALASLLPCVTPTSCCGMGELVGGWCAVVLMLPGVKAGFR